MTGTPAVSDVLRRIMAPNARRLFFGEAGLACLLAVVLLMGSVAPGHAQENNRVPTLAWMAGCWEMRDDGLVVQEHWLPPVNGELLGLSRTIRRDSTIAYEFLRIYQSDGGPVLAASPSGQSPTEFGLEHQSVGAIEFLNPGHDFPQRVRYRAIGSDSLVAEIAGMRGGVERTVLFTYARVACPSEHKHR